jgi:hypothetical protein
MMRIRDNREITSSQTNLKHNIHEEKSLSLSIHTKERESGKLPPPPLSHLDSHSILLW